MEAHRVAHVSLKSIFSVNTQNILTFLYNTQLTKCSDSRGRVFAILGIVDDTDNVEIDYSIPVQAVYRNWAAKRTLRTRTFDILAAVADSSRSGD